MSGNVGWVYDNDFRVTSEMINAANPIPFTYDADSLLTGAGAMTLTRDPQNGLLTGTALGSLTDRWTYNTFGEPASYAASYTTTPVSTQQYTRDEAGRIIRKTEALYGAAGALAGAIG